MQALPARRGSVCRPEEKSSAIRPLAKGVARRGIAFRTCFAARVLPLLASAQGAPPQSYCRDRRLKLSVILLGRDRDLPRAPGAPLCLRVPERVSNATLLPGQRSLRPAARTELPRHNPQALLRCAPGPRLCRHARRPFARVSGRDAASPVSAAA